jgi:two-component sensor histidine kinase
MIFSRFESVRGRLLAVVTLILLPIALISIILATTTYRAVSRSIEMAQVDLTSNYAVRARVWFRGALRTLVASTAALHGDNDHDVTCSRKADNVRVASVGVHAIFVRAANGGVCVASGFAHLTDDVLSSLAADQVRKGNISLWGGAELGEARYDVAAIGPHTHLVVFVRNIAGSAAGSEALMLLDPHLLDVAFDIGNFESGSIVALVSRGQRVIASRGIPETDKAWLPENESVGTALTRAAEVSKVGERHVYVSQIVAEPDLYVLARFDNAAANAAFTQFLVLCVTPLLMLVVLFATYVWSIEGNVLRWLKAIEAAARARREGRPEQVVIADPMPSDVKLLAHSFNEMVADANSRETALRASFEANQFLMRELHHRVKNSLQVIQSYLAISRRLNKHNNDRHMIETEAKVQVLSTAYRLALLEGTMRPVPLSAFVQEILGNLATSLRRKNQWIEVSISADAGLIVDRTIPVGLALVEATAAGLLPDKGQTVHVTFKAEADGHIEMAVMTDEHLEIVLPPPKIMAGLALQIGATVLPADPGVILRWRFIA